jgi:hypothetical protein
MSDVRTRGPAAAPAEGALPTPGGPLSYIHWGPVIAGAVAAAAAFATLMAFGSAVGLALASPSPTWRDTSIALVALSGVWILLVALGSFALGGYLAGRVRSSWATSEDEIEFRDGAHGLLVWALAVVLGTLLTWASTTALTSVSGSLAQRPAQGEPAFLAYELDRLFRSERRPDTADPEARAEAGRLLMRAAGRRDMAPDDRSHLARLVAARQIIDETRRAARRARATSIIVAFMTAASLAAGAAAAWFAAGLGGQHRDRAVAPPLRWSWRRAA